MQTEKNIKEIKNFAVTFFKNLKCNLAWEGEELVIKDVPKGFEKFVGKTGPYKFVFNESDRNGETELLSEGSFILKAMTEYIKDGGKTSLLKLNFEVKPKEIAKKHFRFKNAEIYSTGKGHSYDYLLRFTFLTNFQFMNEREQIANSICVYNGIVVNFDIDKYNHSNGRKEDISLKDTKNDYELAKNELKELISKKMQKISGNLGEKLDKETARLEKHYGNQLKELEDESEKQKKNIIKLEEQLGRADENEKEAIKRRINKAKETLEHANFEEQKEKIEKEKKFFINDEVQKHGLKVDNKLMNTTVIYYPRYIFKIFLRRADLIGRQIEIPFNPINNKIGEIRCESCEKEIKEIEVCGSSHVCCVHCMKKCPGCRKDNCPRCAKKECLICGQQGCRDCISHCHKCGRYACKNHIIKNKATLKNMCINCLKACEVCGKHFEEKTLAKCGSCGKHVCGGCMRKDFSGGRLLLRCKDCVGKV